MELRDYQIAALSCVREHLRAGMRAPVIVSPTGTGKTRLGAELARLGDPKGPTLWLAHRRELVRQAADRLQATGVQRFTVRTIQDLLASGERPEAARVIYDEVHHLAAATWSELSKDYARAMRYGLTATPARSDGIGLRSAGFDCITVAITVREAIERKFLVPCEIVRPDRPLDALAADPIEAWHTHAGGRKTIVFAANVAAAQLYAEQFCAAGVRAALVTGEMAPTKRDEVIADYAAGRTTVLVNVFVLTEGFDDPSTEVVLLARGCGSPAAYLQMVGRALRPSPGKTSALLIDLRGASHVMGDPDEDRVFSLDGRGIRRGVEVPEGRFCPVCGSVLEEESGACVDCGYAHDGAKPPLVKPSPLAKFSRLQQDDDEQRAGRLRRWMGDARARGYKAGWAFGKYRAVYGGPPSPNVRSLLSQRGAA